MIGEICTKPVVTVAEDSTVAEAARTMRSRKVGALVVTSGPRPVGILTDRDITIDVVGAGRNPADTRVDAVMHRDPVTVREDQGLFEAAKMFGTKGVRRLPVTSRDGELIGIVTLDDLMLLLGREMEMVSAALAQGMPTRPAS